MSAPHTGKGMEIRAVLIAPDRLLAGQFCATLAETRAFQILADLKKYPSEQTLEIRLRQFQPEVVLIDVASDLESACALVRRLASLRPPVPVIALDLTSQPDTVMRLLKTGAREFLAAPFDAAVQRDAVAGLVRQRRPEPASGAEPGKVIAFASAKPGSGASTLACQTAFALGRILKGRVLLADLDLAAGSVGFYSACRSPHSFLDLLEQVDHSTPGGWESPAVECQGIDVLPAPDEPCELPFDPVRFRQAIDLVRANYACTLLDLPSVFHRSSLLALAAADRTFLVATSELPSLHLARRAVRLLGQLGISSERLEVIINQSGRHEGISGQELERILGCPARITLPDDHSRLHGAASLGGPLQGGGFGEAVEGLAGRLAGSVKSEKRKAGFVLGTGPVLAGT